MEEVVFKIGRSGVGRVFLFGMEALVIYLVVSGQGARPVQAGQQTVTVRHIAVSGDDHDPGIEISATGPIVPRTQTVTGPDRLIVDLPEARPAAGLQKISINRGILKDVRVGLLSAHPPTTRVVLDLAGPTEYRVSPVANAIVVKLGKDPAREEPPVASTPSPQADAQPSETTSAVPTPPLTQSSEPSRARWIMPILVITTVMAMLVIAVVAHLQNRRGSRGL